MLIVFHGENASSFSCGFSELLDFEAQIALLPDILATDAERQTYASADVIVGVRFDGSLPRPDRARLFHVPGAGYDGVDLTALPRSINVCNCFGHETAIAEYVMAALLMHHIPLVDADRRLRNGDWAYWAGALERVHDEIAGKTIGLLGFGHIGKAIAQRARAFDLSIYVANRSMVPPSDLVDQSFTLDKLLEFWGSVDFIVVSVPLTEETTGIVGADSFSRMKKSAILVNVGRGPTVDEVALYEALRSNRIAGAVIDTWYRYPVPGQGPVLPTALPFDELPNIVMTPHMSGWTHGTIRRRQRTIAQNVMRCAKGQAYTNVVREGKG